MADSPGLFDGALYRDDDRSSAVSLGGNRVRVTEVFWSYWYLAAERQAMFWRRASGTSHPWTGDEILASHRFTNAYRASDRVSQYLLQRVIYDADRDARDTALRVLLFKVFNRIETWEYLVARAGQPTVDSFSCEQYARILDERFAGGERLYSAAYIMPSPDLGRARKHHNHLALLKDLLDSGGLDKILTAPSLEGLYRRLVEVPSFGPFLGFQYAIDLNYSPHFDFDEMEFVVPGPGALRGISKCFTETGGLTPEDLIRAMADAAPEYGARAESRFLDLAGRPLQLIDCQNLFCEVDKYARVAHPEVGAGGPTRIKQRYSPDPTPLPLGYPPKWGLPWRADDPRLPDLAPEAVPNGWLTDNWDPGASAAKG